MLPPTHPQTKTEGTALGDHLAKSGALPPHDLARAEAAAGRSGLALDKTLIELGLLSEEALAETLAQWLGVSLVGLSDFPHAEIEPRLDAAFLQRMNILPVSRDKGELTVAIASVADLEVLDAVAFHINQPVKPAIAIASNIADHLMRFNQDEGEAISADAVDGDVEKLRALANDGPVIRLVNEILTQASDLGASDIHIEALEARAQVRFRLDGILQSARHMANTDYRAAVSRLKVMAQLDITERRRPQDGRARITLRGRGLDLRLSTIPTQHGESMVIRLLDQGRLRLTWDALGFEPERVEKLERIIAQPNGIFLVTGPTGAGKTTTLYTALKRINDTARKIVTVEDPIEYSLPGINQVQVRPEIDVTFASALRAILRQDPDVVMVGEIRDAETAENAVRAALMGRLVLSTVHTNTAVGAIDRLRDLGILPFLLGATLKGVLAQRLLRRICRACAGYGCEDCSKTGLSGRIVVSELLEIDTRIGNAITEGLSGADLATLASEAGFSSLHDNALATVARQETTQAEIMRVVGVGG